MKRTILTEKYINPTYINSDGTKVWLDKYGEIVKKEDKNGFPIGYVFAPYVPLYETQTVIESITNASEIISRYAKKIPAANYIVCSPQFANVLNSIV